MKAYTDLEQSKKLAEILPLESADMVYIDVGYSSRLLPKDDIDANTYPVIVSCWSLAALLDVLPYPSIHKHADETWWCDAWVDKVNPYSLRDFKTPVDACVNMIIKLHEQKLL